MNMRMRLILIFIFSVIRANSTDLEDLDLTALELDQFLEVFNLPKVSDPLERENRAEILKRNQQKVLEANKAFLAGNQSWREEINEFSHLGREEFLASHTGLSLSLGPDNDTMSSMYSSHTEVESAELPDSFSSISLVGPAKHQRCGTCSLFSTLPLVEICHAKTFGHRAAYSEQQVLDCSYNGHDSNGCKGGSCPAYARWLEKNKIQLVSERTYPKPKKAGYSGHCSKGLKPMKPRVLVTKAFYSRLGGRNLLDFERKMKRLVFEHGAVATTIEVGPNHSKYGHYTHGVFHGCPRRHSYKTDHAVAVVGYGTENGVDFWLIRNSWGPKWGDHGYMKMQRGVGMCGIGGSLLTINCKPDSR